MNKHIHEFKQSPKFQQFLFNTWELLTKPKTSCTSLGEELQERLASINGLIVALILTIFIPQTRTLEIQFTVGVCIICFAWCVYLFGRIGNRKISGVLVVLVCVFNSLGQIVVGYKTNSYYGDVCFIRDTMTVFLSIGVAQFLLPLYALIGMIILLISCLFLSPLILTNVHYESVLHVFTVLVTCGMITVIGNVVTKHYRSFVEGRFISNISHELRTPLHSIIGATELLSESDTDLDTHDELLSTILSSGKDMLSLVNDILDSSAHKSCEIALDEDSFNLVEKLEVVISSIQHLAQSKHIDVKLIIENEVPPYIIGDYRRIKQILLNFLSNSIKFTEKGHVWLRVKCTKVDESHVKLFFIVEDTGIGVSPENQRKIFQRFMPINHSKSGSGLGLVICKELATLMNGDISLESSSSGSKFTFSLKVRVDPRKTPPITRRKRKSSLVDQFSWKPSILLAEDNKLIQTLTKQMLISMNCTCDVTNNGKECRELYLKNPNKYDAILMDIQMPEMDGCEATIEIRKAEEYLDLRRVCILALSANITEQNVNNCKLHGMDGFIAKPFRRDELFNQLKKYLKERKS